jgi:hypothetical protein
LRKLSGITGGFAPPTPSAIFTATLPANSTSLRVQSAIREDGTPKLQDLAPKSVDISSAETFALVNQLHDILESLPTEQPPGSEDIYGLDTSITWGSDDLMWMNGGPEGCGGGKSIVQATDEEKEKFKKAVSIVDELVKRGV